MFLVSTHSKVESTKKRILAAALNTFARSGFHRASMDAIAREAGVSKGGLYWHFKSKKELLYYSLENGLEELTSYLYRQLDGIEDYREKLRKLIEAQLEFYRDRTDFFLLFRRVLDGEVKLSRGLEIQLKKKRQIYRGQLIDTLEDGLTAEGEGRVQDGKDKALLLQAMIDGVVGYWLAEGDREFPLTRLVKLLFQTFTSGVIQLKNA